MQRFIRNRRVIILGLVILLAIPLTVFLALRQQEIRQRAAGEEVTVSLVRTTPSGETANNQLPAGSTVQYHLYLDTSANIAVNGSDLTFDYGADLTLTDVTQESGAQQFAQSFYAYPDGNDASAHTFRYARSDSTGGDGFTGKMLLATLTFTVGNTPSTGTIRLTASEVVSILQNTELSVGFSDVVYSIVSPVSVRFVRMIPGQAEVTDNQLPMGSTAQYNIYLDTGTVLINGFDMTISYGNNLTLADVTEGSGGIQFDSSLFAFPAGNDTSNHTFRYSNAITIGNGASGSLLLATLTFSVASVPGQGTFHLNTAEVTTPGSDIELPVVSTDVAYTIVAFPTVTPTAIPIPTATPSPTQIPTPTNTPTPTVTLTPTSIPFVYHPADLNNDKKMSIADYNLWARAFIGIDQPPYAYVPDVNGDGKVSLLDFNRWFQAMKTLGSSCLGEYSYTGGVLVCTP